MRMNISLLLLGWLALSTLISCSAKKDTNEMTDAEIAAFIREYKPLNGYPVPANMNKRLGSTHVGGKYYFTQDPYIIEGCKQMRDMGYGIVKLWFNKGVGGYPYHSKWNLPEKFSLKQLAEHPYYKECFEMPFTTIALSIGGAGVNSTDDTAAHEEEEMYELSKYLLEQYKDREVEFILHNWEGDWIMRGGTGDLARWSRKPGELVQAVDGNHYTVVVPADTLRRANAMAQWFAARQRGVERARAEVQDYKCKVYHAIEVNKVMDCMNGIPGIVNHVLPEVRVDMVSWSCYDALSTAGIDDGVNLYKGIEFIKKHFRPSVYMQGQKKVFLGEIGIPEQRYEGLASEDVITANWDTYIAVCLALEVPYIIQWELYCNEPKIEEQRKLNDIRKTDEMRGFWLIRPDGTKSFAADYFECLMHNTIMLSTDKKRL